MTLDKMIAALRGQVAAKLEDRARLVDGLAAVRALDQVSAQDEARADQMTKAKGAIDAELRALEARVEALQREAEADQAAERLAAERHPGAALPAYDEVARVGAEPEVYSPGTAREGTSFFRDLYGSQTGRGSRGADERLRRWAEQLDQRWTAGGPQVRATTSSQVGALVPPAYLGELVAPVAHEARQVADLVMHQPLPATGMSVVVPRGTDATEVAPQASEATAVANQDPTWTDVTLPVATVAGKAKVSRQTLERSEWDVDQIVYADLAAAHAASVEQQVLTGTGTSGQVLGILSTAGVGQMSAFTAAATVATLYAKLAGAAAAVRAGRKLSADTVVAHPTRWAWLVSQLDTMGRPLVVPQVCGPMNALGTWDSGTSPDVQPVGSVQVLPWVLSGEVPTAVGSGPEDQILTLRRQDAVLFEEGDGLPRELRFEDVDNLTVTITAYSYIAFGLRWPKSAAVVGGNAAAGAGLVAPTF